VAAAAVAAAADRLHVVDPVRNAVSSLALVTAMAY
jgi:hypothetical protein